MAGSRVPYAVAVMALGAVGCGELEELTLNQTTSSEVAKGIACGVAGAHAGGGFYRVFAPADHGITRDFSISRVTVAIEMSVGPNGSGSQPAQIIVYRYSGMVGADTIEPGGLAGLTTFDFSIADTTTGARLVDAPVEVTIPAGTPAFVVELSLLDVAGVRQYQVGTSDRGESRPGYLHCQGYPAPSSFVALGYPTDHLIMTVSGYEAVQLEPPAPIVLGP